MTLFFFPIAPHKKFPWILLINTTTCFGIAIVFLLGVGFVVAGFEGPAPLGEEEKKKISSR